MEEKQAASAEPSQSGHRRDFTARERLGSRRLWARDSGSPPPTVQALPPQQLSGPEKGVQGRGSGKNHGFQACQGRLLRRASSGEALPCLSATFVIYFHLSDPKKITTETLDTDCHEMLPLTPSFHSWRAKQDPENSAHGSPAPPKDSVAAGSLGPLAGFTENPPTWGPAGSRKRTQW